MRQRIFGGCLILCALVMLTPDVLVAQIKPVRVKPLKLARPLPPTGAIQKEAVGQQSDNPQANPPSKATTSSSTAIATKVLTDAQREQLRQARLKKLATLKLSRLPSGIFESWSGTESLQPMNDLPPAPHQAFLENDVRFNLAVQKFQTDFSLGNWTALNDFLRSLPKKQADALYKSMLTAASVSVRTLPGNREANSRTDPRALQAPYLTFKDIFELAEIRPPSDDQLLLPQFAKLFRTVITRGASVQDLIRLLKEKVDESEVKTTSDQTKGSGDKPDSELTTSLFTRRNVARILMLTNHPIEAGAFLPTLAEAKADDDHEALNLISQFYLAQYAEDQETEQLENAWQVTQAILVSASVDPDQRKQALQRAVELSGKVKKELGQRWLDATFGKPSERGVETLASIGSDVSRNLIRHPLNPSYRHKQLELQSAAVGALLGRKQELQPRWQEAVELMAMNWLKEANISYDLDNSKQRGPKMQRDVYGNFFYQPNLATTRTTNSRLSPIPIDNLLKVRPSQQWLTQIDASLRPKFDMILAQLYLKVQEEDQALPFIEKLSQPYPRETKELVEEFLRVWTKNHDPNAAGRRSNVYSMMYGYESRAESIPLTRSKQQRNLAELADLLPKLQALQNEPLDQNLISSAFFSCHSTAEVYRVKQIEQILGPFEKVKPQIIAKIAQRMRTNLAGLWRDANVQKQSKTKRNKKDIQEEVLRGYAVAKEVLQSGLQANPNDWSLAVAMASLQHDENNYKSDLSNTAEFSPRQKEAMAMFRSAAQQYIASISGKEEKDYSIDAFTSWYYAGLGAVDLGLIDEKRRNDPKQPAQIRELIEGMPPAQAEWHMNSFANSIFSRMNAVKPQIKHRYLTAGFEIVGDNERAIEARRVYDYYADLVSEIKLDTQVDGNDRVGESPFGLYVNLLHTKEIERESGGFGKYLQNQNSGIGFAYNFGRPTEDYRDKFEEGLRQTLAEHFEVLSVTFQQPSVQSSPVSQEGWRYTPYAYVLLKARGPQVDKIPPLKIDLDFLDTSGYAILPIESPSLPIDAANQVERPFENIRITQILDERQAEKGELILEIKASANGLVPNLETILEVAPTGFEVTSIEEDGVAVSKFDEDVQGNQVLSQRSWMVTLQSKTTEPQQPERFEFPTPLTEPKEILYQRYVDADLAQVEPSILLEQQYGSSNQMTTWVLIGSGLAILAIFSFVLFGVTRNGELQPEVNSALPQDASPFVVITMLQEIQRNNGLSEADKRELDQSINRLESHYFGTEAATSEEPDLQKEAKKWTNLAKW